MRYMTNTFHRKNLIKTCIDLLENEVEINMSDYAKVEDKEGEYDLGLREFLNHGIHECDTVCCFMGHSVRVLFEPSYLREKLDTLDWVDYGYFAFGCIASDALGRFLFSPCWPDSRRQCVARAYRVLTKGLPDKFDTSTAYEHDGNSTYYVPSLGELRGLLREEEKRNNKETH